MSETRNELIYLLKYVDSASDKDIYLSCLLERFEEDLKRRKEDLQNELKQVDSDMETLDYVKGKLQDKLFTYDN